MNREILFKAKRIDNGEWVEGNYITDELDENKGYIGYIFGSDGKQPHDIDVVEVDPTTICQHTGLTDKNGKKIFEGDICRLPKCKDDIAVFSLKQCNYFLKGKSSDYELGSCKSESFEVIGNIFDNPELLEGGAE